MHEIGLLFRPKNRYAFARTLEHCILRENPELGVQFPAEREPLLQDELRRLFVESIEADFPDLDEDADPVLFLAPTPKRPRMMCSRDMCECYQSPELINYYSYPEMFLVPESYCKQLY